MKKEIRIAAAVDTRAAYKKRVAAAAAAAEMGARALNALKEL